MGLRRRAERWLPRPKLWLFGHVHEGYGRTIFDFVPRADDLGSAGGQTDLEDRAPDCASDQLGTVCVNVAVANDGRATQVDKERTPVVFLVEIPSQKEF